MTGLWDSWADDAFVRNVEEGIFFDPAKMHVLNHKGKYLSVRGPLNIARPIQGWPVIVQAGASDAGRKLAAETAEAVFTAQSDIVAGRQFYSDMKGRMEKLGRSREHMKILPGCLVVVGDTVGEARAKRAKLDSLVNDANAIASLSIALGHDAAKLDPDAPLPENIPESNASKTGREHAIALGKRENLTVRQLAQRLGGYSGLAMVGTPASIADEMEEWLETKASDGFTVMFPYLPGGLDDFCVRVIPELQRRGLFRRDYEGVTLRENLGLPQPQNRFFSNCPTTRPRGHTSSLLAGIDAFRDMDHSARDRLEHASTVLQPRDGSEIFSQGDPADAVYAIVAGEGHVRFGAADQGSKTSMVAVCKQGDIFGEIGVIDGGARTSTAIVEGRVRLVRIPASSFLAALSSSAGLGQVVCQMLARRLRWIVTLFQDASFERCDQAALRGLLRLFG